MHLAQHMLLEFHKKMKQTIGDPSHPDISKEHDLRMALIEEELTELKEALEANDVVKTADALADLIYVLVGSAVTWGIDLASVFDEVHDSNMTKRPFNKRADGKVLKDSYYRPADVAAVLKDAAQNLGTGEDGWWLEPTVEPRLEDYGFTPEEVKILQEIKEDFVPDTKSNGQTIDNRLYTIDGKALDRALDEGRLSVQAEEKAVQEGVNAFINTVFNGHWTSYGAWVFDCECGRRQAVQGKLGTRGGLTDKASTECICGKAYTVDFTKGEPELTQTTIEELRKVSV